MADYVPVVGGATITVTASERIISGDPCTLTGPMAVHRPTTAGEPFVGIAGHDADPGADLTVHVAGPVHDGIAQNAINAGDAIVPAWTIVAGVRSQVIAWYPPTGPPTADDLIMATHVCGTALTTAANGQLVRWLAGHSRLPTDLARLAASGAARAAARRSTSASSGGPPAPGLNPAAGRAGKAPPGRVFPGIILSPGARPAGAPSAGLGRRPGGLRSPGAAGGWTPRRGGAQPEAPICAGRPGRAPRSATLGRRTPRARSGTARARGAPAIRARSHAASARPAVV